MLLQYYALEIDNLFLLASTCPSTLTGAAGDGASDAGGAGIFRSAFVVWEIIKAQSVSPKRTAEKEKLTSAF